MLEVIYLLKTCWWLSFIDSLNAFRMTFKSKSLIEVQNLACCPKSSVYVDGEGVADLIVLTVSFFRMQNYLVST